jgi:hypothetical protein
MQAPCADRVQAAHDRRGSKIAAEEYTAAIEKLEITKAEASDMLGVSKRQAERFASGDSPVPAPVAKLAWMLVRLCAFGEINGHALPWSPGHQATE